MNQEDTRLAARCRELSELTREAAGWAEDNRDTVRGEYDGLQRELRRAGRLFRTCAEAAARKMCVGVFGPSQAGKSYLISALARDAAGTLMADFSGELHDFISEINPEGGKESTGLVTRFTTDRAASPAGHPVRLQLLTETDLVKILANTYYADCEHRDPPDPVLIGNTLNALEKLADSPPEAEGGATLDDLEDLREYLNNNFRSKPRVQELERCFWIRALSLGPRLAPENRVRLYALLWDEAEPFTRLLGLLLEALQRLGYPAEAFVPLTALIPRAASIIDVARLAGLGLPADGDDNVELLTGAGLRALLPRTLVTALTAELSIFMHDSPDPLFNHTDLLDFPGYRSRYKIDDIRRELDKPDMLKELFLRGKVAYLFQRYCARRELTSMLLCIGPGNQEVQDLPGVIRDWVHSTHGETPERRADKPSALYFVLTKFDAEFEQKKGALSVENRWDTRLHASLLDFFGKQDDWPRIWNGKHAFNNLFLLRNPNFRFDAILNYDKEGRESAVRPDQQDYVQALESAFMHSPLVAEHFQHPRESWDAAMRLNDGGISLIRARLQPLCDPAIKRSQIRTTLVERQALLAGRLQPFWKSDDLEELRQQKAALFRTLATRLAEQVQMQTFGEFLYRLGVRDHELYELYFEAEQQARESGVQTPVRGMAASVSADDILSDLFGDDPGPAPEQTASLSPDERRPKDAAAAFAALMESRWLQNMHTLSDDPVMQRCYALSGQDFAALVNELALGAQRLKLRETLEDALRKATGYANMAQERLVWKQASLAAGLFNAYISWMGFNPREKTPDSRTVHAGGKTFVLFEPPAEPQGMPELSEIPVAHERQWYMDWLRALQQLIADNVNFDGEQDINVEQNARVGGIIRGLAPQQDNAS